MVRPPSGDYLPPIPPMPDSSLGEVSGKTKRICSHVGDSTGGGPVRANHRYRHRDTRAVRESHRADCRPVGERQPNVADLRLRGGLGRARLDSREAETDEQGRDEEPAAPIRLVLHDAAPSPFRGL